MVCNAGLFLAVFFFIFADYQRRSKLRKALAVDQAQATAAAAPPPAAVPAAAAAQLPKP
jgi:hypothetical protein